MACAQLLQLCKGIHKLDMEEGSLCTWIQCKAVVSCVLAGLQQPEENCAWVFLLMPIVVAPSLEPDAVVTPCSP